MKKLKAIRANRSQKGITVLNNPGINLNSWMKAKRLLCLLFFFSLFFTGLVKSQTVNTCYTFDEATVPTNNTQHAFDIYGNGNPGFLSDWHVTSGTPSIQRSGDIAGINAYEGNQYALIGPCNASAGWAESLSLSHNFLQGHSYQVTMAVRTEPYQTTTTPINVDFILLNDTIPFNYQTQTGCTPTPSMPSGAVVADSLRGFNASSWQVITVNISNLSADYSELWFRPSLMPGSPLATVFFMIDSLCINETGCSNIISYANVGTTLCDGDSIQFVSTTSLQTTSWHWDFGDGTTSSMANPLHFFPEVDTFTVSLTTAINGCIATSQITGIFDGAFSADVLATPPFGCQQCVDLTLQLQGGTPAYTYQWLDGQGNILLPIQMPWVLPNICQANNETYIGVGIDANGCMAYDTVTVSAYNPVIDTFYICNNSTAILDFGPGANNYFWQNFTDTSGNSTALSDTTQTYLATQPGTYFGYADFPGCGALTSLITVVDTCPAPTTTTCYTFDEATVPTNNLQHAFNIYGDGNPGFLSNWYVTSGTPSIQRNGDIAGVNAYEGNQYALIGPCNASAGWGESMSLSHNFLQGHSYQVSMAVMTKPYQTSATPIDVDFILLNDTVPFNYQTQTGCTPIPAVPSGAITVHSLTNYNQGSWQVITFNVSNLNSNFSQLWFRPTLSGGSPLSTIFFMIDSLCIQDSPCSNIISYTQVSGACAGDSIQFVSTANTQTTTWHWDFGDGTTSSQASPVHFFGAGVFTITLTTTDANGCIATSQQTLTFTNGFTVDAGVDQMACFVSPPDTLTLNGLVSGNASNYVYQWSPTTYILGNSNSLNPSVLGVGNYITYTLTVTDTVTGCSAFDTTHVTGTFYVNDTLTSCGLQLMPLAAFSGALSYHWYSFKDLQGNVSAINDSNQTYYATQFGDYYIHIGTPCGVINRSYSYLELCPDSVWPGDANSDGYANNLDLLTLGIGYGATGINRLSPTNNWLAQEAFGWVDTLVSGVNYKHIDCNGHGSVEITDTLAIVLNYGMVHNKAPMEAAGNGPLLYAVVTADTVGVGTHVTVSIRLGTSSQPANDVYGLAFTVNFDPTFVDTNSVMMSYSNSWLGVQNQDMLGIRHLSAINGKLDAGTTRINHINASGYGEVANMSFITIDNLSGKDQLAETLLLSLSDVTLIDKDENTLPASTQNDSLVIVDESIGIGELASNAHILVYPNPATDVLFITGMDAINEVRVYNAYGQMVMLETASHPEVSLNISSLSPGIYYAEIRQKKTIVKKPFTIIDK